MVRTCQRPGFIPWSRNKDPISHVEVKKKKKEKKTIANIKFYYSNEVINLPSENNCKNI